MQSRAMKLNSDKLRHDQKCKNMKHSQDMQLIQKLRDDQKRMKKVFEVMSGKVVWLTILWEVEMMEIMNDGNSSGDDADGEDEDEEEEEEDEHFAPTDSTIVIPVDEPVFPPEGTEPVTPHLYPLNITIGARIYLGEACYGAMAPPAHSPPLQPSSGCPTQIQTLRISSTQAFIDAVTTALPSPPLPPLPPSLYILPPVDHRDDIPESEQLLQSDYGFVSMVDAEERQQGIRDVGYGIRDTWVDLAEAVPEIAPDLYALLEDAQDSRSRISQRVDMDSQRVDLLMGDRMTLQETIWMVEEEAIQTIRTGDSLSDAGRLSLQGFERLTMGQGPDEDEETAGQRSTGNINVANTQKGNGAAPKGNGCFECGAPGHFKRDCPKLKNKDGGLGMQGVVLAVRNARNEGNARET
ncbi:putative reverse transcriptase domain-containing protein [Tanacetum coccineum]